MTRILVAVAAIVLGGVTTACRQPPARPGADVAQRVVAATADPDQARLWQQVAEQGTAVGLDRVVASNRPVTSRQPPAAAPKPAQSAVRQPPVVIPPRVETQIRILTEPEVGPDGYTGAAKVAGVSDDRLELELGTLGRLVVLARAAKAPIPVKQGEQVRLVYIPRRNLRRPEEVLVIRTAAGKGIGRVIQGAGSPIEKMTVPLFGITAAHEANSSRVTLTLGADQAQGLVPGGTARLGDLFVRVVASYARTGSAAAAAEGPPYLINLLVWSP